jgi:hypothetical protein
VQATVDPQEYFLVDIASFLFGAQQARGHAEHTSVVQPDKLFEGVVVLFLRGSNQDRLAGRDLSRLARHANGFHLQLA